MNPQQGLSGGRSQRRGCGQTWLGPGIQGWGRVGRSGQGGRHVGEPAGLSLGHPRQVVDAWQDILGLIHFAVSKCRSGNSPGRGVLYIGKTSEQVSLLP